MTDVVRPMLETGGSRVRGREPALAASARALQLSRPTERGVDVRPAATMLAVNNIEVVYDHVILVLKGVSLAVPEGGHRRPARRQRRRQDHDAEGHLQPARAPSGAR